MKKLPSSKERDHIMNAWSSFMSDTSPHSIATHNAILAIRRLLFVEPDDINMLTAGACRESARALFIERNKVFRSKGNATLRHLLRGTGISYNRDNYAELNPIFDHTEIWIRDGKAVCLTSQPYEHALNTGVIKNLGILVNTTGVGLHISAESWHYPTKALLVEFWKPGISGFHV